MKNFFSSGMLTLALCLGLVTAASAQSKAVPARTGAVAAETSGATPATKTESSATQSDANASDEAEQSNVVLFTGTVKQDKLKALPGATIYVKATKQMAVADENGDFSLELDFSNGPVDLDVSYAGFEDQNVTIADPNLFMVVQMAARKKK